MELAALDLDLQLDAAGPAWRQEQQKQEQAARARKEWLNKLGFFLLCIAVFSFVLPPFLPSTVWRGWSFGGINSSSPKFIVASNEEKLLLEEKILALELQLSSLQTSSHAENHRQQWGRVHELEDMVAELEVQQAALNTALVDFRVTLSAAAASQCQGLNANAHLNLPPLNVTAINELEVQIGELGYKIEELRSGDSGQAHQQKTASLSGLVLQKSRKLRKLLEASQARGETKRDCPAAAAAVTEESVCPPCPTTTNGAAQIKSSCQSEIASAVAQHVTKQKDAEREARESKIRLERCVLDKERWTKEKERSTQDLQTAKEQAESRGSLLNECQSALEESARALHLSETERQKERSRRTSDQLVDERVDFASQAAGATIDYSSTSKTYVPSHWRIANWLGSYGISESLSSLLPVSLAQNFLIYSTDLLGIDRDTGVPEDALSSDMRLGSCWPMDGRNGQLAIKLGREVLVDRIAVEHIGRDKAVDMRSAPNKFRLLGSREQHNDSSKETVLLEASYTIEEGAPAMQTFVLPRPLPLRVVKLLLLSNHGNQDYTCLYRLRVFGHAY